MRTVCPVNCQMSNQSFIKFGWQIGGGAGVEEESGAGGEHRRGERRRRVEGKRKLYHAVSIHNSGIITSF